MINAQYTRRETLEINPVSSDIAYDVLEQSVCQYGISAEPDDLQLKFSGKLFVNERMCHQNHQLAYEYHQLKSARKIHSTSFYNSSLHIKLVENGPIHKIFNPTNIEKVFGVDNFDEYINNVSF